MSSDDVDPRCADHQPERVEAKPGVGAQCLEFWVVDQAAWIVAYSPLILAALALFF